MIIATIAAEIKDLVAASGVDPDKIAGLGVAAPGPINLEEGTVVDPPLLLGWDRVPLRDALAEATGLSTLVDKDVTSAAVAETWAGGPSGSGSFVFMYMGTGIGCGIVLNDEVVRGTSGNAGEIGHIIVDPDGAPCDCGLRGCVKSSCIPQVLVAQAEAAGILEVERHPSGAPAVQESFAKLCEAADAGNSKAGEIIDQSAVLVARAVAVVTNTLDVERVVFGGPFWTLLSQRYLDRVPAAAGGEQRGPQDPWRRGCRHRRGRGRRCRRRGLPGARAYAGPARTAASAGRLRPARAAVSAGSTNLKLHIG